MRCCRVASLSLGLASILSGQVRSGAAAGFSPPAVRAIAAGGTHSVILASDGTVWAWGSNSEGQLGNGPFGVPPGPAEVSGLSGVVAISAGFAHTLALKSDGTVWAWGKNREGQLGDGTTAASRSKPVPVRGLSGVVAIAAGNSHGLAIRNDGTVWAWGWPGLTGDATATDPTAPAPVRGLTDVTAIAAGQAHFLALKRDGTVWAWGNNAYGQAGDGTIGALIGYPSAPAHVGGLTGVTAIAAGCQHSMALKGDGTVWVWGNDGAFAILRPTPVEAAGITNVRAIAAGCGSSLAVKGDGTVWEWGIDMLARPTGPTPTIASTPTQVTELSGAEKVSLPFGGSHGLALKGDGTVWEWGALQDTQAGWASMARPVPSRIGGLSEVAAVSGRLVLKGDGTVWVWDPPVFLGWPEELVPYQASGLSGVVAIASGAGGYNLALKNDGTVWNVAGPSAAYQVPNLSGVAAVAAGESRALAVKRDGTAWEWSGDAAPVQVSELSDVAAAAEAFLWYGEDGGLTRSVALKREGTVWVWDGAYASRTAPVRVSGLAGIAAIAGGQISLAVKEDRTVWQWDVAADRPAPVQVRGLADITAVAVGSPEVAMAGSEAHALALRSDGTVWAWGPNEFGQLGDGTTAHREAPVQVAGLSEVAAIGTAGYSSVAVKRDGTVWAWGAGANRSGSTWSLPQQVAPLGAPDLAIAMSHAGDFVVGGVGVYRVSITNSGRTGTSGAITVTDTLPPGLTFVSAIGNGWTCTLADRMVTCIHPGPIGAGASTVIDVTVRVEPQAFPGVTNLATVANESDFSPWNNAIGDPAVVSR